MGFGERRLTGLERAVDLIGGHMQKPERLARRGVKALPVTTHRFEQLESADHIGFDERLRAVDGAVDMRLGGKVEHRARLMFGQQPLQQRPVADIAVHEHVLRVA
ncbi:hypothetical protein D3C76_1620270 [compost metagenome]